MADERLVVHEAEVDDFTAVLQTRLHSLVAVTGAAVGHPHQLMHTADAWIDLWESLSIIMRPEENIHVKRFY